MQQEGHKNTAVRARLAENILKENIYIPGVPAWGDRGTQQHLNISLPALALQRQHELGKEIAPGLFLIAPGACGRQDSHCTSSPCRRKQEKASASARSWCECPRVLPGGVSTLVWSIQRCSGEGALLWRHASACRFGCLLTPGIKRQLLMEEKLSRKNYPKTHQVPSHPKGLGRVAGGFSEVPSNFSARTHQCFWFGI